MPRIRFKKFGWSLFWIPAVLALSFGIYFLAKWGLKPKPIPQINPTQFESLEQVGAVTYRRLRPALRQEKMVVLGSSPWLGEYDRVWNGFLAAAREDNWQIELLLEESSLRPIKDFAGLDRQSFNSPFPLSPLLPEIIDKLAAGKLLLVHTLFNFSSHRGEISVSKELEDSLRRPWTSITMLGFAVDEEELKSIQPECREEDRPTSRDQYLACAQTRLARRYLRRRLDAGKTWASVERHGLKDYFLFLHQPKPASVEGQPQ